MTIHEIRQKYLDFFSARGHHVLASASLIPENDPSTLFTGSGMQPMVPYLLGESHPHGKRLTDSQKCFRSHDIDEVGDNRHTTFFEMLGNWSLGDYFKKEQVVWMFEFLTRELGLDPARLYVTVFRGNQEIPRDEETVGYWKSAFGSVGIKAEVVDFSERDGLQEGRIFYYPEKKNWWSRSGVPEKMPVGEPGGPDSELFWDFGETLHFHERSVFAASPCHVNCDCGRFLEIGNNVFMQYQKTDTGFAPLPKQNVDFGGGLERIAAAVADDADLFQLSVFDGARSVLEQKAHMTYSFDKTHEYAFRVILDHVRAATFLIGDSVLPSNKDQGYFVRRLIRRSVRFGKKLGIQTAFCTAVAQAVIHEYEHSYPQLQTASASITQAIDEEERKFLKTLEKGEREVEKMFQAKSMISGEDAFVLY
jgi:alanyl-tRNA synthetase